MLAWCGTSHRGYGHHSVWRPFHYWGSAHCSCTESYGSGPYVWTPGLKRTKTQSFKWSVSQAYIHLLSDILYSKCVLRGMYGGFSRRGSPRHFPPTVPWTKLAGSFMSWEEMNAEHGREVKLTEAGTDVRLLVCRRSLTIQRPSNFMTLL